MASTQLNVLLPAPENTVIPEPSAAASLAAPLPKIIFLSATSNVVELTVVVVPSTCKFPLITTVPVLSPTAAGSILNVAGPLSVPVMFMSVSTCNLPVPLVSTTISSLLLVPIMLFWK